jgi:exosortase
MKRKTIIVLTVIVAILAIIYWPVFRWLVQSWLSNPYYSHGFLVPVVSGFFAWTKRRELQTREPSIIGSFVIALGILVYILGYIWAIRFLSAFSLLIVLSGLLLSFYGKKTARALVYPVCFLILMVPLPYIQEIGFFLQSTSVHFSAWILKALGLPITTIGTQIHLRENIFTVDLACSGINTLIALLALILVYVYLLSGAFYKRTILFIIAFPIAILANILRITAIILVANYYGTNAAMGLFHDLSSLIFFILAFLCLVLLGRILRCRIKFPVM